MESSDSRAAVIAAIRDATERQRGEELRAAALAETRAIHDQLDALLNCAPAWCWPSIDRAHPVRQSGAAHLSKDR